MPPPAGLPTLARIATTLEGKGMSGAEIAYLGMTLAAAIVFAIVLAWQAHGTRH